MLGYFTHFRPLGGLYVFICVFFSDGSFMQPFSPPSILYLTSAQAHGRGWLRYGDPCLSLAYRYHHAGRLVIIVYLKLWLHRCTPQNPVSSSTPERS